VSDVVIRRVEPSDVPLVRQMRLRALATDPASFGSTYEHEAAFTEETWVERVTQSSAGEEAATLIALRGDEPIGLVTAVRDEARGELFHVFGMWVAPEARGEGLGRRLLEEIEGWIASCGGTDVQLSVTGEATAARRLYESAGYEPDGRTEESPHTPGLIEIGLRKRL
jgi:ribosomal protein S18 acetylase RimI-like enzyme